MDAVTLACVLSGALLGGFVNGLAGFGTALFSLPVWLIALPAQQAVAVIGAMSVVSGLQALYLTRSDIGCAVKPVLSLLIPALIALPLGTYLLTFVTDSSLKGTVAVLMVAYGVFVLTKKHMPQLPKESYAGNAVAGFVGGLLGGAASLSGPIPTMWCALQPWEKKETGAVLRIFNLTVLSVAVAVFAVKGLFDCAALLSTAVAFPATLAGSQIGVRVYRRLSDTAFKRTVSALMLISGALVCCSEFL